MKLTHQVITALMIALLSVGLAAGEIVRISEQSKLKRNLSERTDMLSSVLTALIADDVAPVESTVQHVAQRVPSLVELVVYNKNGNQLARWTQEGMDPHGEVLGFEKNAVFKNRIAGTIRLRWSTAAEHAQIAESVRQARIWSASTLAVLAALIFVIIFQLVLKPVTVIDGRVRATIRGADRQGDRLPKWSAFEFINLSKSVDHLAKVIAEGKQRQSELEKAKVEAERAERAKDQFLANMSHELRTPMNGVMGMAELLNRTQLNEKQKMFANVIHKSGSMLVTIIDDILDFSKIDAGEIGLDQQEFELAPVVEDVAELLISTAEEKGLELAVRIEPGLPKYYLGDGGRIRQVLTNIVGNAIKFTDAGHVMVDVSGDIAERPDGKTGAQLHFKVQDTGIGIPQKELDRIFEKFNQVDGSSTRKKDGTGLGLSICKMLLDLMGGKIGVTSMEGAGSTFWFTVVLPVCGEIRDDIIVPKNVAGKRILVVDDNHVHQSVLMEQLQSWSLLPHCASSGKEALKELRRADTFEHQYDLIILDFHMPEMNGAEVAKYVRTRSGNPNTPIIMLMSVESTTDAEIQRLDIQGHLLKPVRAGHLRDMVISVLQKYSVRPENRDMARMASGA